MYYPDQRSTSPYTLIRRECLLPEKAVGRVRTREGKRVDVRDVVADGFMTSGYVILEVMNFFGLRDPDKLNDLLQVDLSGANVLEQGQVIAGKNPNRGKRLFAPVRGLVVQVADGRIIMKELPETVEVQAGVTGKVVEVYPHRGVLIEAAGGYVQGMWGNNRRTIATLRVEPERGLEAASGDVLEMRYMGTVVLTRSPITEMSLEIMQNQNFNGLIAPSMDAALIDQALQQEGVIMLTEGFGNIRMTPSTYHLLTESEGKQITVDAQMPNRWESHYPEVIINTPAREARPSIPNPNLALRKGLNVRVTRPPYAGLTGEILDLPNAPVLLENGLRVICAHLALITGERAYIPAANLEVLSR